MTHTAWSQGIISGKITKPNGSALKNITVLLSGNANAMTLTEEDGHYFFNLPYNGFYTVTPYNNMAHTQGVSAFDVTLMSKHILNVQPLSSPYRIIAADVDKNGVLDTLDLALNRLIAMEQIQVFPDNTSWRFIPADFVFPNPADPFTTAFPEAANINDFTVDMLDVDFIGIKTGDVNESAIIILADSSFLTPISEQIFQKELKNIRVFPNPFSNVLYFDFKGTEINNGIFQLVDVQGNMIISKQFTGNFFELQNDKLINGVYIYKFMEKGEIIASGKVVLK